jgi:hypothetical protein
MIARYCRAATYVAVTKSTDRVLVQKFALQSFATLIFSAEAYLSFRSRKVATRLREGGNTQLMRGNQSAVYVLLVAGIQHPIQFRRVSLGDTSNSLRLVA